MLAADSLFSVTPIFLLANPFFACGCAFKGLVTGPGGILKSFVLSYFVIQQFLKLSYIMKYLYLYRLYALSQSGVV